MTEKKSGNQRNGPEDFDELETASDLENVFRTKRKINKSRKKEKAQKKKNKKNDKDVQ